METPKNVESIHDRTEEDWKRSEAECVARLRKLGSPDIDADLDKWEAQVRAGTAPTMKDLMARADAAKNGSSVQAEAPEQLWDRLRRLAKEPELRGKLADAGTLRDAANFCVLTEAYQKQNERLRSIAKDIDSLFEDASKTPVHDGPPGSHPPVAIAHVKVDDILPIIRRIREVLS